MKRENIEHMLGEISNEYLEEAMERSTNKERIKKQKFQVAVAVFAVLLVGSSVTFVAAKNTKIREWISSFVMQEKDVQGNKGVVIKDIRESGKNNTEDKSVKTSKPKDDAVYYLSLTSIPNRFTHDEDAPEMYRIGNSDTKYFTVAYFHLQSDFTNVLPQSNSLEKYESKEKNAYIATSKREHRIWIQFTDTNYMVEIRDCNKQLSKKEIKAIIDGARVSRKQSADNFEILQWTKELNDSYNKWLAQNATKQTGE